jgi:hypothetical protein
MSNVLHLEGKDPAKKAERHRHELDGDMEIIIKCWSCHKNFSVWIDYGNLNASLFDCTYCGKTNDTD